MGYAAVYTDAHDRAHCTGEEIARKGQNILLDFSDSLRKVGTEGTVGFRTRKDRMSLAPSDMRGEMVCAIMVQALMLEGH